MSSTTTTTNHTPFHDSAAIALAVLAGAVWGLLVPIVVAGSLL